MVFVVVLCACYYCSSTLLQPLQQGNSSSCPDLVFKPSLWRRIARCKHLDLSMSLLLVSVVRYFSMLGGPTSPSSVSQINLFLSAKCGNFVTETHLRNCGGMVMDILYQQDEGLTPFSHSFFAPPPSARYGGRSYWNNPGLPTRHGENEVRDCRC